MKEHDKTTDVICRIAHRSNHVKK